MKIPYFDLSKFYNAHSVYINKLTSDFYSSGQYFSTEIILDFEKNLAKFVSRKFAITVGCCTDALYFSLKALDIGPGDEVILPSVSFIATLSPVLRAQAIPIFSDIDEETGLIDFNHLETLINPKVKAILLVDLYGNMHNPDVVKKIYNKYKIPIIIDAAQSIGSTFNGVQSGHIGTISCFSFDPTKVIHAFGTGGAILTDDPEIVEKLKLLRYHGKKGNDFALTGYNSRINSLQATLLNFQLELINDIIENRRITTNSYSKAIEKLNHISTIDIQKNCLPNCHKFVIKSDYRDFIRNYLEDVGIQTQIHYPKPLYRYSLLKMKNKKLELFKHAETFTRKVLSIPIHTYMDKVQISYICDKLAEADQKIGL